MKQPSIGTILTIVLFFLANPCSYAAHHKHHRGHVHHSVVHKGHKSHKSNVQARAPKNLKTPSVTLPISSTPAN